MKLKKLVEGIPGVRIHGSRDKEIYSLCNDSRSAAPGCLFFAKKGSVHDGHTFIPKAIAAGCVAIVTDLFDPFIKGTIQVVCPDVKAVEAIIASRFYGEPSKKLKVIGVTGTNGKTTSSYLIKHILESAGINTGLSGTVETVIGPMKIPAKRTTEDLLTGQKLLFEMTRAACLAAVLEVSSHGLDQGRVEGIHFTLGLFTNLSEEHLDYHVTMEEYAKAKAKLFEKSDKCVVNNDSPYSSLMVEGKKDVFTYGLTSEADLFAKDETFLSSGTSATFVLEGKEYPFYTPLIGEFNLYNCLGAVGSAYRLGIPIEKAVAACKTFTSVPGRMERVDQEKKVFIDYAHTPDALERALKTLRSLTKGRLICLFGCGGERDEEKRPKMGSIAHELSDLVFITNDNPRGESPEKIISAILKGMPSREKVLVEMDRKKAIEKAIAGLKEEDTLLVAGKGHENRQIFGEYTAHFDDRIVAKELLSLQNHR